MKIIVIVKQIPDPTQVYISRSRAEAVTEKAERIIEPNDKNALEEALRLKVANARRTTPRVIGCPQAPASVREDERGVNVVALAVGLPEVADALREALAMGADQAILLSDEAFASLDASGTVAVLGRAMERLGDYDLILTGSGSQIGPRLAERLDLPQITNARALTFSERVIRAQRVLADGHNEFGKKRIEVEADLPALVTIAPEANVPRFPPAPAIMDAYRDREVTVWSAADLGLDPEELAPVTQVQRTFVPPERERETLTGEPAEVARELVRRLKDQGLL